MNDFSMLRERFYSFVFDNTFYICRKKINLFDAYEDIKLTNFIEEDVF